MISDALQNLKKARDILNEAAKIQAAIKTATPEEQKLMQDFLDSSKNQLITISENLPLYLKPKKISAKVELSSSEKSEFMKSTGIESETLSKLRKKLERFKKEESEEESMRAFKKPGLFTRISGKFFTPIALKLSKSSSFQGINNSLRKANMPLLLSTYVSIAIFASIISFILAAAASIALYSLLGPLILLSLLAPFIVFFVFLVYPSSEISSMATKIDDELPFAAMHMAAIASSGVEPSRVFNILAASDEYPVIKKEMRKIVNMINFYGYDLTTALKVTSKTTSSKRLAELLGGMAATITGGGDLKSYLEKISIDSMMDYKLRRKKFITIAETYADIYTGLLIAAPLMFMLILVLMNVVTGDIAGMSSSTLALVGIGAIALLNIGFLVFLEVSQPAG